MIRILVALVAIAPFDCMAQTVEIVSTVEGTAYSATIVGTLKKPEGKDKYPAVILMHGCSGIIAEVKRGLDEHAKYLVSRGFATLTLDSFGPRGKDNSVVCSSTKEQHAALYYRQFDAYHALLYLRGQPYIDSRNIFLMGQSHGGSVALSAAAGPYPTIFASNPRFRGIVAYYPWCGAVPTWPRKIVSPLLVFGAEKDDWLSPKDCVSAKKNVNGAEYDVVVYEDAHHGFDIPISIRIYAGHTVGGNELATTDSRLRMMNWFLKHKQ